MLKNVAFLCESVCLQLEIEHMEPALCTNCNQLNAICCCLCEDPLKPFCDICFAEHENTVSRLWLHFSVPMKALDLNKKDRKKLRKRAYDIARNSTELEQDIPSLDTFKQEVNSAYGHLMKVLENWRDRHLATLEKCHSAMALTVKAALAKAKESVLNEAIGAKDDPLESYFQTDDMEVNLLKTEIKEREEALAKACVLSISSDLNQVKEIIGRELVAIPCEKCDELRRELDETEKNLIARIGRIAEENEELQQRLSESLHECKKSREECNRLQGEVRKSQSQTSALQQNINKYIAKEILFKGELQAKDELIAKLQSQLNQTPSKCSGFQSEKLPPVGNILVEDLEDRQSITPGRPPLNFSYRKKHIPPTRNSSKRPQVKWTCEGCHSENDSTQVGCTFCGHSEGRDIFATEVFYDSTEVTTELPVPFTCRTISPKSRRRASSLSMSNGRLHMLLKTQNPLDSDRKSPERVKNPS